VTSKIKRWAATSPIERQEEGKVQDAREIIKKEALEGLKSYKETAIGIGVSSAAKPRSAKRLSKRFVCCCFERRLK
jgi:hypothetical protein